MGIYGSLFRESPIPNNQWPFQDPKLEVPTIYKAYIRPKFQGISPQFIWPNIWYVYVPPSVGSWRSPIDLLMFPGFLENRAPTIYKHIHHTWLPRITNSRKPLNNLKVLQSDWTWGLTFLEQILYDSLRYVCPL